MTTDRRPSRIPVRGSLALALTIGGLALLMGFRSPQDPATEFVVAIDTSGDPSTAPESPLPGAGVSASPSATASPWPTQTPEPTPGTRTATGNAYRHPFGVVQVAVTVEGDQIVDVQALRMPGGDQRSAWISQQVEPMLRESALVVDSARIDVVSGATYTSKAYAYSLQSALDQLAG